MANSRRKGMWKHTQHNLERSQVILAWHMSRSEASEVLHPQHTLAHKYTRSHWCLANKGFSSNLFEYGLHVLDSCQEFSYVAPIMTPRWHNILTCFSKWPLMQQATKVCLSSTSVSYRLYTSVQARRQAPWWKGNLISILIELMDLELVLCCLYCCPQTTCKDIVFVVKHLKSCGSAGGLISMLICLTIRSILRYSFWIICCLIACNQPSPSQLVTLNFTTLIDNFLFNFLLFLVKTYIIKTDICDHYMIALQIQCICSTPTVEKWLFSTTNKFRFTHSLMRADWNHLYSFKDVDKAFNYFIKKVNIFIINRFPINLSFLDLVKALDVPLTSIKVKIKLYLKAKSNPNVLVEYK